MPGGSGVTWLAVTTRGRLPTVWRRVFSGLLVGALALGGGVGCAGAHHLNGVRVSQGAKGRSLNPKNVAARAAGAVGVVITDTGRGLGFVIDPSGYMITNRHVVEDADYIEMVSFPGLDPAPEYHDVEIVYIDPVRDLALLRLDTSGEALPYLQLATGKRAPVSDYVTERDAVVLLSRDIGPKEAKELAHDPGLLAHTGRVERLEVYNPTVGPGPFLGVSAQIVQGQSGGPVLDRWGRAVGVVTWTWKDQKGGFAIPISEAARMLAERPSLTTGAEQQSRAEDRAKSYLAALGAGSSEALCRLTSPSRAREVRGNTVDVLIEQSTDRSLLQTFLVAIDELLVNSARNQADPFPEFVRMVQYTGSDEFMRKLGVDGQMSKDAVVTFFYEIGTAYISARVFGDYDRRGALMLAFQRVHSLDAARSITVVDIIDHLGGVRATVERVDVTPGTYAPRAVATVDIGKGRRIAVQMRLEWGDWYVSDVQVVDAGGATKPG